MAIEGQEDMAKVRKSKKTYPKTTKGNQRKPYQSQRKQSEHEMTDIAKMRKQPKRFPYNLLCRPFYHSCKDQQ